MIYENELFLYQNTFKVIIFTKLKYRQQVRNPLEWKMAFIRKSEWYA